MAQYLLALYKADDELISPETSRQVWAGLDEALEWAELAAVAELRPIEVRPFFEGDLDDAIRANASDGQ